jgi:O-antigen ligase
VWIPVLWLAINGSRQVSQWLGWYGSSFSAQVLEEGNPVDKAVYGFLIIAGLSILWSRRRRVGELARSNKLILLFFLYAGASILWSDFPLVAFKRWVKSLGDPIMVLVLWSDPTPARAVTAAIKRCGFVLIPLSLLFCKYYEHLGRNFDAWGTTAYTGVTTDKNMFGYILFAFGLFFCAALINSRSSDDAHRRTGGDRLTHILLLAMIAWLFPISNSQTALVASLVGIAVMSSLRLSTVQRHFWSYVTVVIPVGVALNMLYSLQATIAEAAGRDATFTGRTGLWETVLQEPINPVIGVGYGSFWLGERLARFWAMYPNSPPIQAHNGYIEVYINLGLIGLGLLAVVLWTGVRKMRSRVTLSLSTSEARHERILTTFGLAYAVAYLFYNVTEATFQGLNFLFTIFLILAFECRQTVEPVEHLAPSRIGRWNDRLDGRGVGRKDLR